MEPEYLALFSNTGNMTIQVHFKDSESSVCEQKLDAGEIQKLISPDGKSFISEMRFDDHLAEIEKNRHLSFQKPHNFACAIVQII